MFSGVPILTRLENVQICVPHGKLGEFQKQFVIEQEDLLIGQEGVRGSLKKSYRVHTKVQA